MGMTQIIFNLENQIRTESVFDDCAAHLPWASLDHLHPWPTQGIAYNVTIEFGIVFSNHSTLVHRVPSSSPTQASSFVVVVSPQNISEEKSGL